MTEVDLLLDSNKTRSACGAGTPMTLWRWQRNPDVQFPAPDAVIAGRNYWRASTIRAWQERITLRKSATIRPPGAKHEAHQAA
jgi:hypothetical protein